MPTHTNEKETFKEKKIYHRRIMLPLTMYVLFCGSYDSLSGIRICWSRIPAVKTDAGCGAKAPDPYSGSWPLRRIFVSNGFLLFLLGEKQILYVK
jgi:hypothetical protein